MRRITLIGFRASGKSTLGRRLAERLGWSFVDADREFERRHGAPLAAWFAAHGEAAFRAAEAALLAELLAHADPLVLATGGGVVLRTENRARLRAQGGLVVYLRVPAEELERRLRADDGGRPSLTGRAPADEVRPLLAEREPLYRAVADAEVAADEREAAVVESLLTLAQRRGLVAASVLPSAPCGVADSQEGAPVHQPTTRAGGSTPLPM